MVGLKLHGIHSSALSEYAQEEWFRLVWLEVMPIRVEVDGFGWFRLAAFVVKFALNGSNGFDSTMEGAEIGEKAQ